MSKRRNSLKNRWLERVGTVVANAELLAIKSGFTREKTGLVPPNVLQSYKLLASDV